MKIIGFQKSSTVDYPGKIAAVVFTPGCNMQCFYCHNKRIASTDCAGGAHDLRTVYGDLRQRAGFLDGVVITGGEPTLQEGLERFILAARALGYAIKLDTNGTRPDVLSDLIRKGLLDFVAMDVKGPLRRYPEICGTAFDPDDVDVSARMLLQNHVDYEFRTTVIPQLDGVDFFEMAGWIRGAKKYVLQQYRPLSPREWGDDERCAAPAHAPAVIRQWAEMVRPFVENCETRGLGLKAGTIPLAEERAQPASVLPIPSQTLPVALSA